jgi:hypothetical protein
MRIINHLLTNYVSDNFILYPLSFTLSLNGERMATRTTPTLSFILYPLSFTLSLDGERMATRATPTLSFILYPLSFILYPSSVSSLVVTRNDGFKIAERLSAKCAEVEVNDKKNR